MPRAYSTMLVASLSSLMPSVITSGESSTSTPCRAVTTARHRSASISCDRASASRKLKLDLIFSRNDNVPGQRIQVRQKNAFFAALQLISQVAGDGAGSAAAFGGHDAIHFAGVDGLAGCSRAIFCKAASTCSGVKGGIRKSLAPWRNERSTSSGSLFARTTMMGSLALIRSRSGIKANPAHAARRSPAGKDWALRRRLGPRPTGSARGKLQIVSGKGGQVRAKKRR